MDRKEELDLAWAAGFFDGEGCICIGWDKSRSNSRGGRWQLLLTIVQVDRASLEEFRCIVDWPGPVRCRAASGFNLRDLYILQASSRKAGVILEALLPFLRVKKAQAEAALEFRDTFPEKRYNRYTRPPEDVLEKRERLAVVVRELKLAQ